MARIGALMAACALALPAPAATPRLLMRHYTSADGLPQDHVVDLTFDRDGFLWLATIGGLSRFDGERFIGFGEAEGLRGRAIADVDFAPDGTGWVATDRGVFWFRPADAPTDGRMFRPVALEAIPDGGDEPHRLLADRSGAIWVGTHRRLWRISGRAPDWIVSAVELHPDRPGSFRSRIQSLGEDPSGAIWVGSHLHGMFRIGSDGRVDHCPGDVEGAAFVRDFLFPGDGSVWTAHLGGVAIFDRAPFPGRASILIGRHDGLSIDTQCLIPEEEGQGVLVASTGGITPIRRSSEGSWRVGPTLDRRAGLPGDLVNRLVRDAEGNLWATLAWRGLVKLPRGEFSRWPEAEEPGAMIMDMTTDRDGRLVAIASKGATSLTALDVGGSPGWFPVSLPAIAYVGWGAHQKLLADGQGAWWVATGEGLFRYDDPQRIGPRRMSRPPDARLGTSDGLSGDDAYIVADDGGSDVWISTQPSRPGASSVSRWVRATGRIENFSIAEVGTRSLAAGFRRTPDGSVWIAFMDRRFLRYRHGRFEALPLAENTEAGRSYVDSAGRLWVFGRRAFVCDRPDADGPRFIERVFGDGYDLRCMVEGSDRRLWFGTNQGVLRYDPGTEEIRRYTVDDGLAGNFISLCARDGAGAIWFSDQYGLARYEPRPERPRPPARARLREVRIAGEAIPLPANGTTEAGLVTILPDRRGLLVEYFVVHHGPGPPPRFQYRMEGVDTDWNPPTSDRRVQYAQLAPGRHRFFVRAIDEDGIARSEPASISLRVLAPMWQRPWFVGAVILTATGLAYGVHRVRVARMIALERIRTRIATDLHDDIGSSLSQISILSQLAQRQAGQPPPEALTRITELAGELVDSLSDVVWAISPRWDTSSALVHRMRRFASELFSDSAVVLDLTLPEGTDAEVDPDVRRQLYLVFKEALHNVRRHASARHVRVELARRPGGGWVLRIEEDGKGFDPERAGEGHGLRSMRRRAERLGGRLDVRSSPLGTTLELTLPA